METDDDIPQIKVNASDVTSGNSGHDVNVEADVTKTASSQMMPVKMNSCKQVVYPDRTAGKAPI